MSEVVAVERPLRTRAKPVAATWPSVADSGLTPADFADIAPCVDVRWGEAGELLVEFEGALTGEQRALVRLRCISADDREEQILRAARTAHQANVDYLAKASPTTAEVVAQVAALTRQMNGVLRHLMRT